MCTVLLLPGGNLIAVNKYIIHHIITTLGINEPALAVLSIEKLRLMSDVHMRCRVATNDKLIIG
jgi:hypothetical protein